jgi:carbamoyl-phosphate synthase small subunit
MLGFLVLETGEVFAGHWNGGRDRAGEVVFNTSHSGYEEISTDPSYFSQIVVMTAPMMGNYGIERKSWESKKMWIEGFVCLQIQRSARDSSWQNLLQDNGIPCLSEVDTRTLTLRLREGGTLWGALVQAFDAEEAIEKSHALISRKKQIDADWVFHASRKEIEDRTGKSPQGPKIAVIDFGAKENILRELEERTSALRIFSSRTTFNEVMSWSPDGIMLTNGPGNPSDVQKAPQLVQELIGKLPIFGICMGHQVLALAIGAKTYKMRFGHRGSNHPIQDSLLDQIYMTSQNHGYAVEADTLPSDAKITQRNLNDGTVAGFFSESRNFLGIQYHPESHPGPHEAVHLFDFFINRMVRKRY